MDALSHAVNHDNFLSRDDVLHLALTSKRIAGALSTGSLSVVLMTTHRHDAVLRGFERNSRSVGDLDDGQ